MVGYRERETLITASTMTATLPNLRAGTASVATIAGWMTGTLRETSYVHDAAGRVRYILRLDASSTLTVSERQYDGAGRVVAEGSR